MTKEEKRKTLERMLKGAPDIMSPRQVHRWSPIGKNHVYELIHKGELCAYNYRSSYIIAKVDLIDYLLALRRSTRSPNRDREKKEANKIKSANLFNNQHSYY